MKKDRIAFVVAHDRDSMSLIAHGTDNIQESPVRAAHVDEIRRNVDDRPRRSTP
jgi:hypothetical protein